MALRGGTMERLTQLEQEVKGLQCAIERLQLEVDTLRKAQENFRHPVEALLSQRGLPVLAHGSFSHTLLPPVWSPEARERLYRRMRRYSFRLFLRDLIQYPAGDDFGPLTRYCSPKTVLSYLEDLQEMGIVTLAPPRAYRLIPVNIPSFGPTLEWYVGQVFEREFWAPALFNVRLGQTRFGGDYDVIALINGYLIYVEVKSSPPRGIELPAVAAFLNRLQDLQPHVALFLIDTELRMLDKMVPLFAEALESAVDPPSRHPVSRLHDELFHIHHAVYILNSRSGIYSNLRVCFRDYLASEKRVCLPFWERR
jgi:hypothetical protein